MKQKKKDFDFKQVEVFCHVVDQGSFSAAAKAMSLTQPTTSAHIACLEKTLDCKLMDRKGRQIHLTKEGKIFYEYARKMLALKEKAAISMHGLAQKISGELIVGASTVPGSYVLPPLIGVFKNQYPEVEVTLTMGSTQEIIAKAKESSIELGIVGAHPKDKTLDTQEFWKDKLVLVVPAEHKWANNKHGIRLDQIAKEPLIARENGSGTRQLIENVFKEKGIPARNLNVTCKLGGTEAVKQGIAAGLGISIISEKAVEAEVRNGLYKTPPIRGASFTRCFYLIRCANRTPSPASQAFLDTLTSQPY